ncbi:unnamed protein product [Haemonchus placei]|uniref:Agmatine deiminase n=1 Tax=Haemonchus placei TaxID=6290 RepID=A0A0N4X1U8_HAEPC|nr:unnamed protein product [Haemonchus placei]
MSTHDCTGGTVETGVDAFGIHYYQPVWILDQDTFCNLDPSTGCFQSLCRAEDKDDLDFAVLVPKLLGWPANSLSDNALFLVEQA